jgi:hypothetical protein
MRLPSQCHKKTAKKVKKGLKTAKKHHSCYLNCYPLKFTGKTGQNTVLKALFMPVFQEKT